MSLGIFARSSFKYEICRNIFFNSRFPYTISVSCIPNAFFHSSVCRQAITRKAQGPQKNPLKTPQSPVPRRPSPAELRKIAANTVDWLPFPWTLRDKFDQYAESGDFVKELEFDPSWPKPDFELSDVLKTADEDVKKMFTLATANKAEIKEVIRRRMLEKIQRHPTDLSSLEVKTALLTLTIRSVFEHSRDRPREKMGGRRALNIMIKRRNRNLKFLLRMDMERFNWLIKELNVEFKPQPLGGIREKYTKQWDLRRLTKEYSAKLVKDKKIAYHEELKKQQADFLKEKEEILAWIEKEESELAKLTI